MSGLGENAFEILAAKERKSVKVEKLDDSIETQIVSTGDSKDSKATNVESEDSSWTVQSSVKTRRLVPQFSLSRQDLGSENSRNKPVAAQDQLKKKVIRFTKEEMLALRKPSKILAGMSEMLEVVSLTTLDPVCFDRLEPEDVVRIWNMESNRNNTRDMGGRGRGRTGRGGRGPGDDHHQSQSGPTTSDAPIVSASDWSRGQAKAGPWDGGAGGAGSFELADFAAAALKFRSEMADMKLADGDEVGGVHEDTMERLLREQCAAQGTVGEDDDDDAMPDWAADGDSGGSSTGAFGVKLEQQPLAKRNLLLETLNVKASPSGGTAAFKVDQKASGETSNSNSVVSAPLDLSLHPSVVDNLLQTGGGRRPMQAAVVPELVPAEWFYTDPQGQVQGPFSQENMQLWHEAGYFSRELPIKLRTWLAFHPFCLVFPSETALRAFSGLPHEPRPLFPPMPALMSHNASLLAAQEQQLRQQQQMEQQQLQHQLFLREQQVLIEQQRQQELLAQKQQLAEDAARRQLLQQQQSQPRAAVVPGPPPLVPAASDSKPKPDVASSAAAPVPLDALRKIRISTNISELNAGSGAKRAVDIEPRKKVSSNGGPPPLIVQDSGAGGKSKDKNSMSAATATPWTGASDESAAGAGAKESMVEIQRAERERAERDRMAREAEARQQQIIKGKGWAESGAAAGAAKLVTASLSDIQQEEESRQQQRDKQRSAVTPQAAPLTMSSQLKSLLGVRTSGLPAGSVTSPAPKQWGGASVPGAQEPSNGKSLRDIMQQEEKKAPERPAAASGSKRQQPLSWAAKAGTGVNASNLIPTPIQQQQQQHSAAVSSSHPKERPQQAATGGESAHPKVAPVNVKSVNGNSSNAKTAGGSSSGNDFGGKGISREMSDWCSAQLRKITGSSDDLSALVDFCMSLDSASEIREYLSQYLGSSPQLTNFATDFIKVKEGGKKALLIDASAPAGSAVNKRKNKPQQQQGGSTSVGK